MTAPITKYLSDGRKVAIVGKLNAQETIVQEVFVTKGGQEVPSGENFVVKSLHDEPVTSWKDGEVKKHRKAMEEAERYLATVHNNLETARAYVKQTEGKLKGLRAMLRSSTLFHESFKGADLDVLADFLSGTAQYVVFDVYGFPPPCTVAEAIIGYETKDRFRDGTKFCALKLMSVFGGADGNLQYRINEYCDGSGCWQRVHPFATEEAALDHIKRRAESMVDDEKGCNLSSRDYAAIGEMGISLSPQHQQKYDAHIQERDEENIKRMEKEITERQGCIAKLRPTKHEGRVDV